MQLQLNSSAELKSNLPKPLQVERKALIRDGCVECEGDEGEGESRIPFFNHIPLWQTKKFQNKN